MTTALCLIGKTGRAYALTILLAASAATSAIAAESVSELKTGGLLFSNIGDRSAVVLDSEDIRLSPERVSFKYKLSTTAQAPVSIDLLFPYPDLDFADPDASFALPGSDPANFVAAVLKIGGAAAPLAVTQAASLDGKDITAKLRQAKLPLVPVGGFQNQLEALPQETRQKLIADGLIKEVGTTVDGKPLLFPVWTVKTEGKRNVAINPGKPLVVELTYLASAGISQDTPLRKALRDQKSLASAVAERKSSYCIDNAFLGGVDAIAGADEANVARMRELRLRLSLRNSSEADLPATAFTLTVDKGKATRIVTFCSDNLKKVGPTTFKTTMTNFVPKPDFGILLLDGDAPRRPAPPPPAPLAAPATLPTAPPAAQPATSPFQLRLPVQRLSPNQP